MDVDFDEMVMHVRRRVKTLGREFVFASPENDTERTVNRNRHRVLPAHAPAQLTNAASERVAAEYLVGSPTPIGPPG